MTNLKKYFVYTACFILIAVFNNQLFAQGRFEDGKGNNIREMIKELDLSSEQKEELKELFKNHRTEMKKDNDEKRGDFHKSILTILNDDQKEKFGKMVENSPRAKMKKRFDSRIDEMALELNLDAGQKEKLEEMMAEKGKRFANGKFERRERKNCCFDNDSYGKRHHKRKMMKRNFDWDSE
ncbi:MAG: hypothetical protein JEY94_02220 [Melioribacteraceae bacterium]|nr:hypothetical protein [Melioribacteraceae bacterium]